MMDIRGYTPDEAFEARVRKATEELCAFDPDAASYRQRTEAWVRLVLAGDDRRMDEATSLAASRAATREGEA